MSEALQTARLQERIDKMIIELWEMLGKPIDLIPVTDFNDKDTLDDTLDGYITIKDWLIKGYERILSWKPAHRGDWIIRERPRHKQVVNIQPIEVTGTGWSPLYDNLILGSLDDESPIATLDLPINSQSGIYDLVVTEGSGLGTYKCYFKTFATGSTSSIYVVGKDLTWDVSAGESAPFDSTSVMYIYPNSIDMRFISLNTNFAVPEYYTDILDNNMISITNVRDILNDFELEKVPIHDSLSETNFSTGTPTQYAINGRDIILNYALSEDITYEVEYAITGVLDFLDSLVYLPIRYQYLCVLWGAYLGKLRNNENDEAYSFRGMFEQDIKNIMSDADHASMRMEGGFIA